MERVIYQVYKEYNNGDVEDWFVGKTDLDGNEVMEIGYHQPMGEGDAHYCDVSFSNGGILRVFKPDTIEFVPEVSHETNPR